MCNGLLKTPPRLTIPLSSTAATGLLLTIALGTAVVGGSAASKSALGSAVGDGVDVVLLIAASALLNAAWSFVSTKLTAPGRFEALPTLLWP